MTLRVLPSPNFLKMNGLCSFLLKYGFYFIKASYQFHNMLL